MNGAYQGGLVPRWERKSASIPIYSLPRRLGSGEMGNSTAVPRIKRQGKSSVIGHLVRMNRVLHLSLNVPPDPLLPSLRSPSLAPAGNDATSSTSPSFWHRQAAAALPFLVSGEFFLRLLLPPSIALCFPSSLSAFLSHRKFFTSSPSPFVSLFGPTGPNRKALFGLVGSNRSMGRTYCSMFGSTDCSLFGPIGPNKSFLFGPVGPNRETEGDEEKARNFRRGREAEGDGEEAENFQRRRKVEGDEEEAGNFQLGRKEAEGDRERESWKGEGRRGFPGVVESN